MTNQSDVVYYTVKEVSISLGVEPSFIHEVINEGIIHTHDGYMDEEAICLIKRVVRLHLDLGINIQGAALVLELLEEREHLHALLSNLLIR